MLAAVGTFVSPWLGNAIYVTGGIVTALSLFAVGGLDLADGQRAAAIPPVLAFILAVWNGYGSWISLRNLSRSGRDHRVVPE